MPHESVLEMEILTGDGQVVTAAPGNEHSDLFAGFPNSYGPWATPCPHHRAAAGPAARAPAPLPVPRPGRLYGRHRADCREGGYQGHRADFVDGVAFSPDELYLTVGAFSDVAPWRSDYTGRDIYYTSIRGRTRTF